MEFIEDLFKKITGKKEQKPAYKLWEYALFKEYLLSLTRRKEFLLSLDQYPDIIELSGDWHAILNKMRADTLDGIERWALIGYKEDRRGIFLPEVAARGGPDSITPEVRSQEMERAEKKAGITGLIGDIHSHPKFLSDYIWAGFNTNGGRAIFSAADLFFMVMPKGSYMMAGLVEGDENLFVFRTKESTDTGIPRALLNQETFEKYWYEECGFDLLGNRIRAKRVGADPWNVNLRIADRHRLVLYKGPAGRNLTRVTG